MYAGGNAVIISDADIKNRRIGSIINNYAQLFYARRKYKFMKSFPSHVPRTVALRFRSIVPLKRLSFL